MLQRPVALLLVFVLLLAGCSSEPERSQRTIIIDDAHILTGNADLLVSYEKYNQQLRKDFQIDFRVVTTNSDEDIDLFANRAFGVFTGEEHGSKSGRALLLVINAKQDLARLEVGMALEPIYTDAFTSFIEEQHMVHFFRDNRLAEGIFATTEKIYSQAREAAAGHEFLADMPNRSLGGGAKTGADIGRTERNVKSTQTVAASATDSPQEVLAKYIQSRRAHNDNPELDIFTDETKAFFRQWTVTPVQMDNEVQFFGRCTDPQTRISADRNFAAVLFPIKQRKCTPYLLKREEGSWKLDFATMNKLIRFNHEMKWHLILDWEKRLGKQKYAELVQEGLLPERVRALLDPYLFAFVEYLYDLNGYPYDYWGKSVFRVSFDEYADTNSRYAGTYIVGMHSLGAGKKSGLERWDRIVSVGGKRIGQGDLDFISQTMRSKKSGETLRMTVERRTEDGGTATLEIVMTAP